MKLADKIVAASQNPTSTKSRVTARLILPTLGETAVRPIIGSVLIVLGVFFLLWTTKAQREIGKGTPMPLMATQKLIIQKPYSYCRNPLFFGLLNFS